MLTVHLLLIDTGSVGLAHHRDGGRLDTQLKYLVRVFGVSLQQYSSGTCHVERSLMQVAGRTGMP
jgi:hypothetical protein